MVGKPNFPENYNESKSYLKGAAMTTGGLDPLDQEREASMADEGGASGAAMESQDKEFSGKVIDISTWRSKLSSRLNRRKRPETADNNDHQIKWVLGILAVFALVGFGLALQKMARSVSVGEED